MDMLPFGHTEPTGGVPNNQDIPTGEMDIFEKLPVDFLPEGKTFSDLTPDEARFLQSQYRFSPLRPSTYQAITGLAGFI